MKTHATNDIQAWRIPFDVDRMVDDGCNGRDLWPDDFGEEVVLLSSSDGSAYVCPDDPEADWRLYVDSGGRQTTLFGAPERLEENLRRPGSWPTVQEIVACGIDRGVFATGAEIDLAPLAATGPATRGFDGQTFDLGAWTLAFAGDAVRLNKDEVVYEASGGVAVRRRRWEAMINPADPDSNVIERTERAVASNERLEGVLNVLVLHVTDEDAAKRAAAREALIAFDDARGNSRAIAAFEALCRDRR